MRLYICIDGSFAGTQADANAKGRGWTQADVPTDKAGLIDYLNGMVDEARGASYRDLLDPEIVPTGSTFDTPPEAPLTTAYSGPLVPAPNAATQRQWDADAIVDFLHDRATTAQVEAIFAAIGTRFAEERK